MSTHPRNASLLNSLNALLATGIPAGTILDVGIQDGTPALMSTFHDRPHVLFEPVAEYTDRIKKNYEHIEHTLVPVALSDVDSDGYLMPEYKTRGTEVSHAYLVESQVPGARPVTTLRLDTYLAGVKPSVPYVLKIDVEGADIPRRILLGAKETLQETSIVIIEMTVTKMLELVQALHEYGFVVWDICEPCYYGGALWQVDGVFVRADLKSQFPLLLPMQTEAFDASRWQGFKL